MPSVGDKAEWGVSLSRDRATPVTGVVTMEIMGRNLETDRWKIRETQNFGEQQVIEYEKAGEEMIYDSDVADYLNNCAAKGGRLATLKQPAGEFTVCELQSFRGSDFYRHWVGQVPFGIVKTHIHYGEENLTVDSELRQFGFGR